MQREIPFREIRQVRQPVSKGALSALAHGFLLAVCQSEDRYKGGFFPIKIKLSWPARKSNTQMLEVQDKGIPGRVYRWIAG